MYTDKSEHTNVTFFINVITSKIRSIYFKF